MYAEFDDAGYSRLRRSLVRKVAKGSSSQREFLEAVRDSDRFLAFIRDAVSVCEGEELSPLADRMSEAEFGNPPSDTERRLFENWGALTPRIACRTAFWARVTCRHIEAGRISSSYLAANGGGTVSGAERIDQALGTSGDKAASRIDGCVRTALRRLGGLPEARGNKSVYVNCPLARAWWRERLVAEVMCVAGASRASQIRAVVHPESQQFWEELVMFVVSRNSVFGSIAVRNALIQALAERLDEESALRLLSVDELKRVCRAVSSLQASFELSVMPADVVQKTISDIVGSVATG